MALAAKGQGCEARQLFSRNFANKLKLPPMERHFLRATLLTVYKLFHCYLKLSAEEVFEPPAAGNLRGHNFKVRQPRFHLARRKAAFAVRSAGPWNRLPPDIAEAPTLSSFEDRLDANWCSIFPDIVRPYPTHCSFVNGFWRASAITLTSKFNFIRFEKRRPPKAFNWP